MFITIVLITSVMGLFYMFLTWNFNYWSKKGVAGSKPKPFIGTYPNALSRNRHIGYDIDDVYRAFRHQEDFVGMYSMRSPQLLITSPELVHKVYVDYFPNFRNNEISSMVDKNSDSIFGRTSFILTGEAWKENRSMMTQGLTMSRIKASYPITNKVCRKLTEFIKKHNETSPQDSIEARKLCLRFSSEIVTDCVLGIEAGSFTEKPTPIVAMIKELFEPTTKLIIYFFLVGLIPSLKKYYKTQFVNKKIEKFFTNLMQNAIDLRKSDPQQVNRSDFLNYMLQIQEKKGLTTLDITANAMTFLSDGFETTAGVLSHLMLQLGRNPEVQERLYNEIIANINENGFIEFDELSELPYLDSCIHESIRIIPPGYFNNKLCTEPIVFTNRKGQSVRLEKGDVGILPLYSIMVDEDLYSDPLEYKPERFLEESVKELLERGIYYGFGDGPRTCLGMRFALVQLKAVLVEIIRNFKIRVNPKTRKDNLIDPKQIFACLDGGIWLHFDERS